MPELLFRKELIIPDSGDGNSLRTTAVFFVRRKELIIPDSGDGNALKF